MLILNKHKIHKTPIFCENALLVMDWSVSCAEETYKMRLYSDFVLFMNSDCFLWADFEVGLKYKGTSNQNQCSIWNEIA